MGERPAAAAPRSLGAAARTLGDANVALISVPGEYAVLEAHRALTAGLHVFLFSDHVSAADELELKRRAAARGLLLMGPGCGTAMLGNVGLGFANVVRPGPVGIVAAAGTGAQEAAVLLDGAGTGVSHIVGVGGRDLSAEIGGIMFGAAMRMLAADDATETLLLVSKPPAPEVVRALGAIELAGKRVVGAFVGWDGGEAPFEIHPTLDAGAFAAARSRRPPSRSSRRRSTRAATGPRAGCSACTRAARSRTRRSRSCGRRSAASAATRAPTTEAATRSSTSARRSTPRAGRIRWSTSGSGWRCSSRRRPTSASAASCSTS